MQRADDDALFNAGSIGRLLRPSEAVAQSDLIMFGRFKNTYSWHVESMMAQCWSYDLDSTLQCMRWHKHDRNTTLVGPFSFAAGPFIAYSRPLAAQLTSLLQLAGTEAYVLGNRSTKDLVHPFYNTIRAPSHTRHPTNLIFLEEVYLAYLAFRFMPHRNLVLLPASMSDLDNPRWVYNWTHRRRIYPHIYHNLKDPSYMGWLANSSLLSRNQQEAVVCRTGDFVRNPRVSRSAHLQWRRCDLVQQLQMTDDEFVRYDEIYAKSIG